MTDYERHLIGDRALKFIALLFALLFFSTGNLFAQTDVSSDTVTATGATTARALGDRAATTISVLDEGAMCDGVNSDSGPFNAAMTLVSGKGGGIVSVPTGKTCYLASTVTIPANVYLVGSGQGNSVLQPKGTSGFTMIQISGANAGVRDIGFNNATAKITGMTAVSMGSYSAMIESGVKTTGFCLAIDINGNTINIENNLITDVGLYDISGASCYGMRVGYLTTGAQTADVRITTTTVGGSSSSNAIADLLVLDSGGLVVSNSDLIYGQVGTLITPGLNQAVEWSFFSNTELGDSSTHYAFRIDTSSSFGIVKGLQCNACWAATSGLSNISINNTSGGTVSGIHFDGLRDYNGANNGAVVTGAVSNITFDASHFCGNATGDTDIYFDTGVSGVAVRNSEIGGACDGFATTPGYGVTFVGSNNHAVVTGNDFTGVTTYMHGSPIGDSVVADNTFLDSTTQTVASAATVTISNYSNVYITGTTSISNISDSSGSGTWAGRTVRFITTSGAVTFTSSGGTTPGHICNTLTSTMNKPVTGWYSGATTGCWFLS